MSGALPLTAHPEWCVALDDVDEIDRIPRSRCPACRTENLVHRQVGFVQPKSEFGIILGREETSACLFVVEPLDQRLLAGLFEDRLDDKVVVVREFDGIARVPQRLKFRLDGVRETAPVIQEDIHVVRQSRPFTVQGSTARNVTAFRAVRAKDLGNGLLDRGEGHYFANLMSIRPRL